MTRISFKHLVLSGLLAGMGTVAMAQATPATAANPPAAQPADHGARKPMPRHDPAKLQARMAERQAALKAALKITADQEPAWNAYTAGQLPPARDGARPDRDALRKMTTPERIEHMRAQHAKHQAEMDSRLESTLRLYSALNPEQQKVFDQRSLPHAGHGPRGHGPRGPHEHHRAQPKG